MSADLYHARIPLPPDRDFCIVPDAYTCVKMLSMPTFYLDELVF